MRFGASVISRRKSANSLALVAGIPIGLFLLLPIAALFFRGANLLPTTISNSVSQDAIFVSLKTSMVALLGILVFGTPLAIFLGRSNGFGARAVGLLVEAPVVLPPAAAGIGLLLALGRHGLFPTHLPFSVGAVVVAQGFVAAPLFIRSLAGAIHDINDDVEEAAAIDGATPIAVLRWVTLPLVASSVVAGLVLAWCRSLGEFGATILFAGNLQGRTQTMPLAIYLGLESDLDQAVGLSVMLLIVAFTVLSAVRILDRWRTGKRDGR